MRTITRTLIFLLSINICLFSNEFSKKSKNQIKQKISSHQNQIFKNQTIKKLIQQKRLLNNNQRDECEDGFIDDCSGDGDCCPESPPSSPSLLQSSLFPSGSIHISAKHGPESASQS